MDAREPFGKPSLTKCWGDSACDWLAISHARGVSGLLKARITGV